jgi:RNA polymerase sigma factor (sigma-70 family)
VVSLAAVQEGGPEAFAALFTSHARAVYAFCGRRTGDWGGAEDLMSVVFLEAWRTRERAFVTGDGLLLAWLLGIARHVTAMSRRSLRRYDAALSRFAVQASAGTAEPVEDEALRRADRDRVGRLVTAAVGRLPRDVRAVAELCLLAELDVAVAAEVLELPVSVVASRLVTGRVRLRRLLRSREIDEPSWLIGNDEGERHRGAAEHTQGSRLL